MIQNLRLGVQGSKINPVIVYYLWLIERLRRIHTKQNKFKIKSSEERLTQF
jgi:hypothetical protein